MKTSREHTPISLDDRKFFQDFYESNIKFMYYTAKNYASAPSDQEDIVQDALMRLMRNIPKLRELSPTAAAKYIVLTLRSAFLDNERRKHGGSPISLDDAALEALIRADLLIADSMPDLSARLEVEQLRRELPTRDWLVLEGKYVLGYSQEELAAQIGVSPDSIRMILCRAREKARKILRQEQKGGQSNG